MRKKKWDLNKRECYDTMSELMKRGMNATEAKLEYMRLHELPEYVVREAYYSVKNELFPETRRGHATEAQHAKAGLRAAPCQVVAAVPPAVKEAAGAAEAAVNDGDSMLSCLSDIIVSGERSGLDMEGFFAGIYPVFQLAAVGATYRDKAAKINTILADNQRLKSDLETETQKVSCLKKQIDEMKRYITELDEICETFLKLSGSQKIVKLADLTSELKYIIDKSGVVQSVQRVEAR